MSILLCLLVLSSCKDHKEPKSPAFDARTIGLSIGGKSIFLYDELNCQCSLEKNTNMFRAFSDDMGDYFILTSRTLPLKEGQEVVANIEWAVGDNAPGGRMNVPFTVTDVDLDGLVYLWSSEGEIGAVVKVMF